MTRRSALFLPAAAVLLAGAAPLAAQTSSRADAARWRRAAETITGTDVRQHLSVIADDSMRGPRARRAPSWTRPRPTSPAEFRRVGLRPGGDSGTFLQRYGIRRTQRGFQRRFVMAMGRGATATGLLGREAALVFGQRSPSRSPRRPSCWWACPADTARPFGDVDVRGTIVLQVLAPRRMRQQDLLPLVTQGVARRRCRPGSSCSNRPRRAVRRHRRAARCGPQYRGAGQAAGLLTAASDEVRDSSAAEVLRAAGEDLAALRDSAAPAVRALPGFTVTVERAARGASARPSAPNVIGILEGSDPQLRNEYVFFTGHMDHIGVAGGDGRLRRRGRRLDLQRRRRRRLRHHRRGGAGPGLRRR